MTKDEIIKKLEKEVEELRRRKEEHNQYLEDNYVRTLQKPICIAPIANGDFVEGPDIAGDMIFVMERESHDEHNTGLRMRSFVKTSALSKDVYRLVRRDLGLETKMSDSDAESSQSAK